MGFGGEYFFLLGSEVGGVISWGEIGWGDYGFFGKGDWFWRVEMSWGVLMGFGGENGFLGEGIRGFWGGRWVQGEMDIGVEMVFLGDRQIFWESRFFLWDNKSFRGSAGF